MIDPTLPNNDPQIEPEAPMNPKEDHHIVDIRDPGLDGGVTDVDSLPPSDDFEITPLVPEEEVSVSADDDLGEVAECEPIIEEEPLESEEVQPVEEKVEEVKPTEITKDEDGLDEIPVPDHFQHDLAYEDEESFDAPPKPEEEPDHRGEYMGDIMDPENVFHQDTDSVSAERYPPLEATNEHVTIKYDVVVPRDEGRTDAYTSTSLPSITAGELRKRPNSRVAQVINETQPIENDNDSASLTMVIHMMLADVFGRALKREDSDWQQSIEQDGQSFRPARPKFKTPENGSRISQETAIRKLEAKFGLGGHITVPLIHSGLWVRLRPPTSMEFAFLNEKIQMEKDEFGKRSLGLAFTNNKTFIVNHLMDFIEAHVEDMSLENWVPEDLRRLVKVSDLFPLVTAALHSMYPTGFDYVTPCVADEDCGKPSNFKLKVINAIWFDRSRLTRAQKRHMLDRTKHYTEEEIMRYQDEIDESRGNKLVIKDSIEVYFRVPTIADHIVSGYQWFDDIESIIDRTFGGNVDHEKRLSAMNNSLQMTMLRQYAHFVKSIRFVDDETFIEGEDVNQALNRLSGINDIADEIIEGVSSYIEEQSSAVVALPRVPCPHCGGANNAEVEKHPYLIPIDPINLFFTMGDLKTQPGSQA